MDFSQKLKQLMDERKLSAYKVANDIHCSQTSVRNWLSGASAPQPRTILMLCDYFGISEDELMGREENVQKKNLDTISDAEAKLLAKVNALDSEKKKLVLDLIESLQ